MRCKTCSYPLWNTPTGNCPECGDAFLPSTHTFRLGEVIFRCPDCGTNYFGDTEDGHLNPAEFNCVGCQRRLHENDCLLFPSDGDMSSVVENQMPWFDTRLGHLARWFATIGWSMAKPTELGRSIPRDVFSSAFKFVLITTAVASFFGLIPNFIFSIAPSLGNSGIGVGSLLAVMSSLLVPLAVIIFICIEGLIAHAVLRLTGGCAFGLGQTMAGTFFGSGQYLLLGIPCIGPCFTPVVLIWCLIGKSIMLANLQQVSIPRGVVAMAVIPFMVLIGLMAAAYLTVDV